MKTQNNNWYLIYTKAREEKKAKENLENQGFSAFLPLISWEQNTLSDTKVVEIMFPNYLFVKLDLKSEDWNKIRYTKGVKRIISFGDMPAIVPIDFIQDIKSKCSREGLLKARLEDIKYKKGQRITIKRGIFKGIEATFLSKNGNDRVRVLLDLINRGSEVELPKGNLF